MSPAPNSTDVCDINNNDKIDKAHLENRCGVNIERIKSTLAKTSNLFGWLVRQQTVLGTTVISLPNLYTVENGRFVRSSNQYPREVIYLPSEEIYLTVYVRFNDGGTEYMGEATGQVLSDEQSVLDELIQSLIVNARSLQNKPYSLPSSSQQYKTDILLADPKILTSTKPQLLDLVSEFNSTILKTTNNKESVDVSNIELFIKKHHNALDTSTGINVEFDSTRADAELCFIARLSDGRVAEATARPHARRIQDLRPQELVQTYSDYARKSARAAGPPKYKGPVIVSEEALANMLSLDTSPLLFHAGTRNVFDKMSRYEQGKLVTDDAEIKGERITIISDPHIPFGSNSHVFSTIDGSPSRPVTVVQDSNYAELIGTRRYYEYLGLLDKGIKVSGPLGNTYIPQGKKSSNELLGSDKIVVVKMFSDWSVNPINGDFACEIRLGETRENGVVTPFKGGLLIGNYFKMLADITLASERFQFDNYFGPAGARFGMLEIAG